MPAEMTTGTKGGKDTIYKAKIVIPAKYKEATVIAGWAAHYRGLIKAEVVRHSEQLGLKVIRINNGTYGVWLGFP